MNKKGFIEYVAAKGHTQKDVKIFLDDILESVIEVLENGEKLCLKDFMTLEVRNTPKRVGRNPRTKEEYDIPASKKLKTIIGKAFKRRIKESNK